MLILLSLMGLEVLIETVFHVMLQKRTIRFFSACCLLMKANKFFLVVIAVFFDSNSRRPNFDISLIMHPAILSRKACGSLGACTDKTSTSVLLSRYVCSCIKTYDLLQHKTRIKEWFDIFFQNALRQSIKDIVSCDRMSKQNVLVSRWFS